MPRRNSITCFQLSVLKTLSVVLSLLPSQQQSSSPSASSSSLRGTVNPVGGVSPPMAKRQVSPLPPLRACSMPHAPYRSLSILLHIGQTSACTRPYPPSPSASFVQGAARSLAYRGIAISTTRKQLVLWLLHKTNRFLLTVGFLIAVTLTFRTTPHLPAPPPLRRHLRLHHYLIQPPHSHLPYSPVPALLLQLVV